MKNRELTRAELRETRKLVTTMCANYDRYYNCCMLLDGYGCYMLTRRFADGGLCKYFKNVVLPLNTELERICKGKIVNHTKPCAVCGCKFEPRGRQSYCSPECQKEGGKIKEREKKRRQRQCKG